MRTVVCEPNLLQPGDHVVTPSNVDMTLKYIDGPDHIGAYDLHGVDVNGKDQIVIVADAVKLIM